MIDPFTLLNPLFSVRSALLVFWFIWSYLSFVCKIEAYESNAVATHLFETYCKKHDGGLETLE